MASLRYSSSSLCAKAVPLGPLSFRRYLQTLPQSTVVVPHFDPSSLSKSKKTTVSNAGSESNHRNGLLWRRHGLGGLKTEVPESDFLESIFDSENPPSKAELEKALSEAKKAASPPRPTGQNVASSLAAIPAVARTQKLINVTPTPKSAAKASPPAEKTYRKFKPLKAAMTLTPAAVAHIKQLLNMPEPKLIRVGVRNRGCSGLQYHLEYVDNPGKFDEEVIQDGVKVLIDSKALFSIIGSEMDWVDDRLSNRFVFHNPNIKGECGCGESFMV
ncbi:hypothetical protein V1520DRAFT_347638 [Lipomyces starkeyi]|uniref:Iron-sulfur assembly protein 1 n=1 Tax=Lipomyces starkeyi NRRL Y-11557 TaxID=675824 RepID=A0A1E3QGE3_LIPST|nr:hypothetical protein LIPSTDRAFT_67773 [Lipomyces starkeyi NRRL Y-11557]